MYLQDILRNQLSAQFLALVVVFLAICLTFLCALKKIIFGRLSHVPGSFLSRATGIEIGYAGFNLRRAHKLHELHAKYGPVIRIAPNEVSIDDWRYYRTIYATGKGYVKDRNFYGGATFVGKDNIFQMSNMAQHSARRRLSAAPYSLQSVTKLDSLIRERAEVLVKRLVLGASASSSGTVDAFVLSGLYSLEVVCAAGFAKHFEHNNGTIDAESLKLLQSMDGSALTLIFNNVIPFLTSTELRARLPGFFGDCYRHRMYWNMKSREMVDHFLRHSSTDDKFLLTPLSRDVDSFLGRKVSTEELVEEAMGYMFAGSGTTSTTLTYLLYALARPENIGIQRKLRKEVIGLPDEVVALRNNHYVNAVIKETFRLFPTIMSTLPRVIDSPLQVGSYKLPAGTVIGMQNYVHHRNSVVFPNPDCFSPDRWLKSDEAMEASLTPFSIGRRGCIGQNLAWDELYIAVNVLMRSRVELKLGQEMHPDEMEMEDRFNIAPKGRRLMLEVLRL